jgi:hypothetical protein
MLDLQLRERKVLGHVHVERVGDIVARDLHHLDLPEQAPGAGVATQPRDRAEE